MRAWMKRLATCLGVLGLASVARATHVPGPNELIFYDASLSPGVAVTGSIGWSNPLDGYDWYCFNVVSGQTVTMTATRTSGDILPNIGLLQGTTNNGSPRSVLPDITNTANNSASSVNLTYTPTFTGAVTAWISTWFLENGGSYQVVMTGGLLGPGCSTAGNRPPLCDAGTSITAACDGVMTSATASDPDGDPLTFAWTSSCPGTAFSPSSTALDPAVAFGSSCGVHCTLVLTVEDGRGGTCVGSVAVTVDDTIAPALVRGTIGSCFATAAAAQAAAIAATTASDNCAGPVPLAATTTGTCAATVSVGGSDVCGNPASVSYATRIDGTPPALVRGTLASCYATRAAAEAAALAATGATDNCPGAVARTATTVGTCAAAIAVTASDGCGNAASVPYATRIDATPPVVQAPAPITLECNSPGGILRSDPQVQAWLASAAASDDCGLGSFASDAPVLFPSGCLPGVTTLVTFTAVDACGNAATRTSSVTVRDTTGPVIDVQPSFDGRCAFLWPPMHGYVDLTLGDTGIRAHDACGGDATLAFASCASSQARDENGVGDGHSIRDCVFTPDLVSLRAERDGGCQVDRSYTVRIAATDACGNATLSQPFHVCVWHDHGHPPPGPYCSANPGSNQDDVRAGTEGSYGQGCGTPVCD